ncbi:sushi, nidogen and EGF-like domain-containing protein 1 isoform X2 [Saccostrea cucullata]|uniref:sushi, nidogen and EGF-like domain-containing protein 1 isoform X2 n=1 Tax=Saccostrea cuccullata TaxID=36930 RepID=UPI002ED68937
MNIIYFVSFVVISATSDQHYPYEGSTLGGDDSTREINLSHGIPVGNDIFHQVYVSTNGLITFNASITTYNPNLTTFYPFLAPFWTDLVPKSIQNDRVSYRVYMDKSSLQNATVDVQKFSRTPFFQAEWMLVATWYNTSFISRNDHKITVQCILITDYVSTYTMYNFINVSISDVGKKIGIGFNNGTSFSNPYSLSTSAYRMSTHIGNTGLFGLWFYTVTPDKNNCIFGTCDHGGVCQDMYRDFQCHCKRGFTGKRCQIDVDECLARPCDQGICKNTVGSYHCTCFIGWIGKHCDSEERQNNTVCSREEVCCKMSQNKSQEDTDSGTVAVLSALLAVVSLGSLALAVLTFHFRRQRIPEQTNVTDETYENVIPVLTNATEQESSIYTNLQLSPNANK